MGKNNQKNVCKYPLMCENKFKLIHNKRSEKENYSEI